MILVLGVWAFVRALLGHSATVLLEKSSSVINWRCCSDQSVDPGSSGGTQHHLVRKV